MVRPALRGFIASNQPAVRLRGLGAPPRRPSAFCSCQGRRTMSHSSARGRVCEDDAPGLLLDYGSVPARAPAARFRTCPGGTAQRFARQCDRASPASIVKVHRCRWRSNSASFVVRGKIHRRHLPASCDSMTSVLALRPQSFRAADPRDPFAIDSVTKSPAHASRVTASTWKPQLYARAVAGGGNLVGKLAQMPRRISFPSLPPMVSGQPRAPRRCARPRAAAMKLQFARPRQPARCGKKQISAIASWRIRITVGFCSKATTGAPRDGGRRAQKRLRAGTQNPRHDVV